jgi:hypothetical protein
MDLQLDYDFDFKLIFIYALPGHTCLHYTISNNQSLQLDFKLRSK